MDLIGDLRVTVGETVVPASAFPGRQGRLTFAYLAAHQRPVPKEELAGALWPGGPPSRWRRDLSWLISRLRRVLTDTGLDGAQALPGTGGCYQLRLPAGAEIDVEAAARGAESAVRALRAGDSDSALAEALAAIQTTRRLFLPGEEGEWIDAGREALGANRLAALDVAATVLGERGEVEAARELADEAVELAPFRETWYARLIRLHLAAGDRAEALRTYHRCRTLLAEELGVEPGPDIQAAYLDALRAGVGAPAVKWHGHGSVDVAGDLSSEVPGNLPALTDRFVGREHDLEMVATALASARLVTLTGVGGVGKSRLALEAAARLAPAFPEGGWWCELSPVAADRDVVHALAAALGISQQQGLSTGESVLRSLSRRRLLLVLDNCEHVLDGVAALLTELLARCPHVVVLATSRERVAVGGERVVAVEPLTVPPPGADVLRAGVGSSAVELFCVRAAAARAGFELTPANAAAVAEICRRLDGVPLALELAAARVATLGLRDVVARLHQRFWLLRSGSRRGPMRSQTLRATVDWSYDLLSEPHQRVFDRLSVFAGWFRLEAAQALCGDDQVTGSDVADAVLALADKSMLVVEMTAERTSYRLLETLREYGRGKLHESGEAAQALRRHAVFFVEQAERAAQGLLGRDEADSVVALHSAFDDLRAAHRWSLDHGEADLAVRLVTALHWYTHWRRRAEVYLWADETLPLAASHQRLPAVCAVAAGGAWQRGDRQGAAELSRLGIEAAGADPVRRLPLHMLGDVPMIEGRLDEAADLFQQAMAAAREAGDDQHASLMSANVALVRGYSGDREGAASALAVARDLARVCGNPTAQAWALYAAGELRALDDDPAAAMELLDASLELARAVDNRFLVGVALVSVSSLRGRNGDPDAAIRTFLEVIRLWYTAGNWSQQWTTLRNVIELFVRLGVDRPAAVLLAALQVAPTAAPPFGPDAERLAYARQTLTSRLDAGAFAAAVAHGQAMEPEAVVDFAVAELHRARATAPWGSRQHA